MKKHPRRRKLLKNEQQVAIHQLKLQKQQTIIIGVTALISFMSLFLAYLSINQSFDLHKKENEPSIILSKNTTSQNKHKYILWNSGKGVAYDIVVEIHLAGNIGNIGMPWVTEVLDAALDLSTKDKNQIFSYLMSSDKKAWQSSTNPPSIIPPGINNGYHSNEYLFDPLHGLFLKISYRDNIGTQYISCWDGINWSFPKSQNECIPSYTNVKTTPVPQFAYHLQHLNNESYMKRLRERYPDYEFPDNSYIYIQWLENEAEYLKEMNFGNIPQELKDELSGNNKKPNKKINRARNMSVQN